MGEGTLFEVSVPLGHAHLPPDHVTQAGQERGEGQAPMFVQEVVGWLRGSAEVGLPDVSRASGVLGRERILVAEDNADMREYIERLLGDHWEVLAVGELLFELRRIRQHIAAQV
jgi:hypothetical protein